VGEVIVMRPSEIVETCAVLYCVSVVCLAVGLVIRLAAFVYRRVVRVLTRWRVWGLLSLGRRVAAVGQTPRLTHLPLVPPWLEVNW